MEITKEKWESLHAISGFNPIYPCDSVVRFLFTSFPKERDVRKAFKILDIGCGAGRHVKLFAEQGFDAYGTDFSSKVLRQAELLLENFHFDTRLVCADMWKLPFKDKSYNGALAFGVFYYASKERMLQSIHEMHRILKPGGKALVLTKSIYDYRYNRGEEIEKNTFIMRDNNTNEKNMSLHFLGKEDVHKYYSCFSEINIEKNEYTSQCLTRKNSDWIITLIK